MSTPEEIRAGLDELKAKVSGLKTRAATLSAARDELIARSATLEQTQAQALAELKELGIVPADLEPATLEALAMTTNTELEAALVELEKTVSSAEALVGGTTAAALSVD